MALGQICPDINQEYRVCASPCELSCRYPLPPVCCKAPCRTGCFCKIGFLRDDNGACVSPRRCPRIIKLDPIDQIDPIYQIDPIELIDPIDPIDPIDQFDELSNA